MKSVTEIIRARVASFGGPELLSIISAWDQVVDAGLASYFLPIRLVSLSSRRKSLEVLALNTGFVLEFYHRSEEIARALVNALEWSDTVLYIRIKERN